MRARKVRNLGLASLALLLSGCVTADDFQQTIADEVREVGAGVLKPCPEDPEAGADATRLAVLRTPQVLNVSPAERRRLQNGGLELIARAHDPSFKAARTAGVVGLGLDLSALGGTDAILGPAGADAAINALDSDTVGMVLTRPRLVGDAAGSRPKTLTLSVAKWDDLRRNIALATAQDGWTIAAAEAVQAYVDKAATPGAETEALRQDAVRKSYVAAYMAAYFRNGEIFAVDLNYDAVKTAIMAELRKTITDVRVLQQIEANFDKYKTEFRKTICGKAGDGGCVVAGAIGEETFVTRAGKSYGFPGITATVDLTGQNKVSTNKIAADAVIDDLVRVFFEALGDAGVSVPAQPTATLCKLQPDRCPTAEGGTPVPGVDAKLLKTLDTVGDRVEAGATTMIGGAVRGGWLFSLNNETVARVITTGGAVSMRKASEVAAWSYLKPDSACRTSGLRAASFMTQQLVLTR